MKVYDFILGDSLSKNYIRNKYLDRFETEEPIQSLSELVNVFHTRLTSAFSTLKELPFNINTIMSELSILNNEVEGRNSKEDDHVKFRRILSLLAYEGFECYLIERLDLRTTEIKSATRAYMIDKNDTLFPEISRVASGYGITFDNPANASLPDVVMSFLNTVLNFDPVTQDIIQLPIQMGKYEALSSASTGWEFDIKPLMEFLDDYGYHFIVALA